jgi:hypothetical protein
MRKARFSVNKRQRERAREDKRKRKAERREQRKLEEKGPETGEDPDLAGIVPGPQPKPFDEEGFTALGGDDDADEFDEETDADDEDAPDGDAADDEDADPAAKATEGSDPD